MNAKRTRKAEILATLQVETSSSASLNPTKCFHSIFVGTEGEEIETQEAGATRSCSFPAALGMTMCASMIIQKILKR